MSCAWKSFQNHLKDLNFYRIHILFFSFTPLIFSAIFYASNGAFHISYIDALYNSVSAMTVCGLTTVDLSSLTPWQQVILFIQMCLGNPVVVSWVIVYTRRYYFAKKFDYIVETAAIRKASQLMETETAKAEVREVESGGSRWPRKMVTMLHQRSDLSVVQEESSEECPKKRQKGGIVRKLQPNMIRRMDDAPKLVNPNGWISEGHALPRKASIHPGDELVHGVGPDMLNDTQLPQIYGSKSTIGRQRRLSDPGAFTKSPSIPMQKYVTVHAGTPSRPFQRVPTIEFTSDAMQHPGHSGTHNPIYPESDEPSGETRSNRNSSLAPHITLTRHATNRTTTTRPTLPAKNRGFGGFPEPHEILTSLFDRWFPTLQRKVTRSVTIPLSRTLTYARQDVPPGSKSVPYISFDAVVGRNSAFHLLTNEQLKELGGVEFRALNALLWIVAGYHIGVQLIAFIVIAPYMSLNRWSNDFQPPLQHKSIPSTWFSLFQVVSAYTNTGMSLVDQSMVPFQRAYPMIVFMMIVILAGNTAFPIFLRFTIWTISKVVPTRSRAQETLRFLLDHPRRCFIYLFPSHQTWFLATIVLMLNFTDWFFFMVLDIGNPAMESIPLGVRFIVGLLQAIAVRAAGFGTVALSSLAPAVKVLYAVMMYVSVYPIAMSVRSTNVYEEQSLGVFHEEGESDAEDDFELTGHRVTIWSRYLAMHARKQLAFDMWWLGLALFLVCIIERDGLDDTDNLAWFNIFSIIFELVSAYGTVGLSLGIPTENYSFSGALRPLSKLIVCLVMLRGRHRGLPVAIDRAVMVPDEFERGRDERSGDCGLRRESHGALPSDASEKEPYAVDCALGSRVQQRGLRSRGSGDAVLGVASGVSGDGDAK